ncbi:MAG: hypothetical protein Tsb0015_17500 [Simkaniaceae bacterium]
MKMNTLRFIYALVLFSPILLFARQKKDVVHPGVEIPYNPWFTGTFLTPTPINMKPKHPAIEPSITIFWNYGTYNDNWEIETGNSSVTINPYLDFQLAFTERTGVEIQVQSFTTIRDGNSTSGFADTNVLFGYQVSNDQKNSWIPDFRLLLEVVFPTGKYDKLDPQKKFDDATGQGAFFIGPNLAFQKLFYLPNNFFILHWALAYLYPTEAHIKNYSIYGGGKGTRGRIRPGQYFSAFIAGEYSLSQKLVLGLEANFFYQLSTSEFKGKRGFQKDKKPASVGIGASSQLMLLPEIQYNFDSHSGIIAGGWFSVLGRNTTAYAAGFLAYLYVF